MLQTRLLSSQVHSNVLRLAAALALVGSRLLAQDHSDSRPALRAGAQGILLVTHLQPGFRGESLAEGYLTQPMIMGHGAAFRSRLRASLVLNFEGETLKRGELNPGVYGEGYVDRRHPHTLLHEAIVTWAATHTSLTAGKGFVPFGTDDPMVRPFVKYPANHHLAQILERAVVVGAGRWKSVVLEVALFNGDEPEDPYDNPDLGRMSDSWAARLTALPAGGLEAQASMAEVTSPENSLGGGLDQRKLSASLRYERLGGRHSPYAMAEFARTDDLLHGSRVFQFGSVLVEGAVAVRGMRLAMRLEQTTRPEEERLIDVFRTARPHHDNSIVGRTRWRTASAAASSDVLVNRLRLAPFLELSTAWMSPADRLAAFDPAVSVFGASRVWSLSAGMKLSAGTFHRRMGRYGAADIGTGTATHNH